MWWLWPHFKRVWAAAGAIAVGLAVNYLFALWGRQSVPSLRDLSSVLFGYWYLTGGVLILFAVISVISERAHRRHAAPRFIGDERRRKSVKLPPLSAITTAASTLIVGREGELAQLRDWYANVLKGERRVVFVSGEAGIGKTTFVNTFIDSLRREGVRVARGQCVEQYGAGEPYMPMLEALTQLGQGPERQQLIALLHRLAPAWLTQLPALLTAEERVRIQSETHALTQQRMLREMVQTLAALATNKPLVILLEDLHWSDAATLDLIAALARRTEPAWLLTLGTCRPVEALAEDHPLPALVRELESHGYCHELRLQPLSAEVYKLRRELTPSAEDAGEPSPFTARGRALLWRGGVLSLAGLAIIAATIVLVQHLSLKQPRIAASLPPPEEPALPLPSIPSIAVLPFTNLSGDPNQEYFSDGISNELINDLSRLPGLFVIARNSSFGYKGKNVGEQDIGKALGVRYVLEGSVQKAADRVRLGVQLVDASAGTEMWTQTFDRPLKDIFAVQDEIVGKIVTTLGLLLKLDEMKLPYGGSFSRTENLEAYDDLLRAYEYFWRRTKDDNERAQQWTEKVIDLDPKFCEAYAVIGTLYWMKVFSQWSVDPQADLARSFEMARKALALDDSNSDALGLLSYIDSLQGRYDQSVVEARRAIAINPNSAGGYRALSDVLLNAVRPEEALRATERAMRLDPTRQDFYADGIGVAYFEMGRDQEAIPFLKRNLAAVPNNLFAHSFLAAAYAELGRDQNARAEAAEIMRLSPHFNLASRDRAKDAAFDQRLVRAFRKAGLK